MRRITVLIAVLSGWLQLAPARAADASGVEAQIAAAVAEDVTTIVHLWAPWCPNCKAEMRPDGWAKFVRDNPAVKVIFVNIWHADQDPAPKLTAGGLGGQPNFVALTHPNGSRKPGERLETLLGQPLTWVPSTWVMRKGRLRYAINYGEVRFEMLQQMVDDTAKKW